ncbi:MAG: aldehyde dehydrogenase family protein [Bifidobacteriaceae bacterium]|jgi:oxepin-CoA hydrolase/3-oxo-5,6-dehydrosuberyl-CoA semialdehyde dehydrogenase|nr:aldehyde dehydrogenase family protein [Bifidobacteriaceae bacterium]
MTSFSYVGGDWVATSGDSADPLVPAALRFARRAGVPGMTRLTFHERARILLKLADHLQANSESLYRLSIRVGATRRDAVGDLAAALGVMRGLADATLADLPDATIAPDGPAVALGRDSDLTARHLYVSPRGVGVIVNASSYFRWSSTARLTPAFLAGVPIIVKPAVATAPVATEIIRLLVEARLAPSGSLQLLNGNIETYWDHLKLGDRVCFTGSGRAALKLSQQPKVASGRVKLITGTMCVNAAVLGPDEAPGSRGFEALVRCVAHEMTTHAGQTGTAIRRVLVPRPRVNQFADALSRYLDRTAKVGDPADPTTTVGPLMDHSQLRHLRRQVKELVTFGGRIVRGGAKPRHLNGPYFEPTVLVFDQPTPVLCDVEPFGPVVSIAGYGSIGGAVRLANDGGSSLVITLASRDEEFLAEVAHGVAPYHARVRLLCPTAPTGEAGEEAKPKAGFGWLKRPEELSGVRAIHQWLHQVTVEGPWAAVDQLTHAGALAHAK